MAKARKADAAAGAACARLRTRALLVVALAAILPALPGAASPHATAAANGSLPLDVLEMPMTSRITVEDIMPLVQQNAVLDLEYWQRKGPLSMKHLMALRDEARALGAPCSLKLLLIYQNTLIFPEREDVQGTSCPHPCNPHMEAITRVLQQALRNRHPKYGTNFPNVLFVMNVNDNCHSWGAEGRNRSAPLLSLTKQWNETVKDRDLLVPQLLWIPKSLYMFPWEMKANKAFFRGKDQCQCYARHFKDYCVRNWLGWRAHKGLAHPMLDIGLTENGYKVGRDKEGKSIDPHIPDDVPPVPFVDIREHARYRFLLQLEGITASYRMGAIMACNSPIIKSSSPYIEWFYRSLQEDVHYFGFWRHNVTDLEPLLDRLSALAAEAPGRLHAMVQAQLAFAQRYLGKRGRVLYYQAALSEYKRLFPDMDAHIAGLVTELRAKGFKLPPG